MKTNLKSVEKENKILQGQEKEFLFDAKITSSNSSSLTVSRTYKNQKGKQGTRRAIVFRGNFKDFFPSLQQAGIFLDEN